MIDPDLRAIATDELAKFLEAHNAARPCEACGTEVWEVVNPDGFHGTYIGLLPDPTKRGGVIPTYSMSCKNCGAMRSFMALRVLRWLTENRDEQAEAAPG